MEAGGRKSGKKWGASMNRPLNKEQVKGLFEQEAVLMGTEDQVPYFRVAALFGRRRRTRPQTGRQQSGALLQRIWRRGLHNGCPDPAGLPGRRQFL